MKPAVSFERVYKRYRLGAGRASLLRAISRSLREAVGRYGSAPADEEQTIWALRDVSFDLARGQALGIIGPNGAGKSTILKMIAGITRPTSGRVQINGRISALIELGAGFHPDLTGRENIYLNGIILGLGRQEIRRRFEDIVAFSELERFIDTPVKRYSSGMYVRLGFAVAACIQPDVLLVDEVLAVGDASFQRKCMERIQELRNGGTSIILVSHNLYLVQALCTSSLYIESGQVMGRGQTPDVIAVYERDLHRRQAETSVSLPESGAASCSDALEITSVEVLGADSVEIGAYSDAQEPVVRSDQPVEVRVNYTAHEELDCANAVIRIIRSDNVTCCMMRTSLDGFTLSELWGEGTVSLVLDPIQLIGGTYLVEARIRDASDSLLIAVRRSGWFHVNGRGLSYEEYSGVFEPRSRWSHHTRIRAGQTSPVEGRSPHRVSLGPTHEE